MPGFSSFQKSVLENVVMLVVIAILAGILGGGMVGLATGHHSTSTSSTSGGLGGQ